MKRAPRSAMSSPHAPKCVSARLLTFSMGPCSRFSSSFEDCSKATKYGSSSSSDSSRVSGGNRPNICGPGVVCAAAEGNAAWLGGEVGVPELEVAPADLSFAEDDGTGR